MRAYVFTDPALASYAGRFVWLDMNTEKKVNAAVRRKYPIPALPSYFIVDPETERVKVRWVGSATVAQFTRLLNDALRDTPSAAADSLLAVADRLYGEGKSSEAAAAFRAALDRAPEGWPGTARASESMLFALYSAGDQAALARAARDVLPRLRGTTSAALVAAQGLDAAVSLPDSLADKQELVALFDAAAGAAAADTTLGVSHDDRSGIYISLLGARQAAGDSLGARAVAERWAAFLESAAARARTPEQRTVYDSHRLSAYLELGEPERAIPMLEASARDLPADYNPHARLAVAYQRMERWDEALAAVDRALLLSYGPRQLRIYQTKADILAARGERDDARKTLEQAIAAAEALPEGQRSESAITGLKKKLEGLK